MNERDRIVQVVIPPLEITAEYDNLVSGLDFLNTSYVPEKISYFFWEIHLPAIDLDGAPGAIAVVSYLKDVSTVILFSKAE